MWTLRSEKFLKISGKSSEIISKVIVDTADELPRIDEIPARILHQGSMAYVVKTGEVYILSDDGEWCKASPQSEPTYAKDYEYEISDNSVTITKYVGSAKNIAIPQKIEGLTVTKIGGGAFSEMILANQQMYTTINTTKNISTVDFESTGEISGNILSQSFSVREETVVFANISVNLRGIGSSEIKTNLLFDDVENRIFFQYIFWAEYCKK